MILVQVLRERPARRDTWTYCLPSLQTDIPKPELSTNNPTTPDTQSSTPAQTSTLTATPTSTSTPTSTQSPLELTVGDSWSDDRVTLELDEVKFNQEYYGSSAIWMAFEFNNHSGTDILLRFQAEDFSLQDNVGRDYNCWYILRYPYTSEGVNATVKNGSVFKFTLGCGKSISFDEQVSSVVLGIEQFSSLPSMAWTIEIPR